MGLASVIGGLRRAGYLLCLGGGLSGLAVLPVQAGTGFVPAPLASFEAGGGAVHAGVAITLDDNNLSYFRVPLIIPPDYKKNTPIKFTLNLHNGGNAACTAVFKPYALSRGRAGKKVQNGTNGLKAAGGDPLVDIPGGTVVTPKIFLLEPGGPLKGQKPGDSLSVAIVRDGTDISDTCTYNVLMSVEVTYTTK